MDPKSVELPKANLPNLHIHYFFHHDLVSMR